MAPDQKLCPGFTSRKVVFRKNVKNLHPGFRCPPHNFAISILSYSTALDQLLASLCLTDKKEGDVEGGQSETLSLLKKVVSFLFFQKFDS